MPTITADFIESKLRQWQAGLLTAAEVHEWAGSIYCTDQWEPDSEAVNEVLSELDRLDMSLVTPDDIPMLLAALRSDDFASIIRKYFDLVDFGLRRTQLSGLPLYARFCG